MIASRLPTAASVSPPLTPARPATGRFAPTYRGSARDRRWVRWLSSSPRVVVLLAAICASAFYGVAGSDGGGASAPPGSDAASGRPAVPPAARAAVSAMLGAAEPAFAVRRTSHGGLAAWNPTQRIESTFTRAGLEVRKGRARLRLHVSGIGFAGGAESFAARAPVARANRVSYRGRAGVSEFYANEPAGLEQGFTVPRPSRAGRGPLVVSMSVTGNVRASVRPDEAVFSLAGRPVLAYRGLEVRDAGGRRLPARLALPDGGRLEIRIDASGADFPLRVDPFVQSAELKAPDGGEEDFFGESAAVSEDDKTIVVGAPGQTVDGTPYRGAAFVFEDESGNWVETAELTASDVGAGDGLGDSVAISGDGSTVVVGAPGQEVNGQYQQGAVHVFSDAGGSWVQTAELTASDGGEVDGFGAPVAISRDGATIAVATNYFRIHRSGGEDTYIFSASGGSWTQTAALSVPGELINSMAMSADGRTVATGAAFTSYDSGTYQGAVYVFADALAGWARTAKLTASNAASYEYLGRSVAVSADGREVVSGAPGVGQPGSTGRAGRVFVFSGVAGDSTETAELVPPEAAKTGSFGYSVGVAGDGATAVVNAFGPSSDGTESVGVVHVFADGIAGWGQTEELRAPAGGGSSGLEEAVISRDATTVLAGGYPKSRYTRPDTEYVFSSGEATIVAPTEPTQHEPSPPSAETPATVQGSPGSTGSTSTAGTSMAPLCRVPKLTGKKLKGAKKSIRGADCAVGKVRKRKGATPGSGRVVKESPKPGTTVPAGTKVKVTLASPGHRRGSG